jgi:hypothetical protein
MSARRSDEDLSLAQIAIRVGAAFALTVVIAVLIFVTILFVLGTG